MSIEELPHFINHDIEYEDGEVVTYKFFLSVNRDSYGKWSVGYVHFRDTEVEDDSEMVIPELFFNSADNLSEIAFRMKRKLERYGRPR